MAARLILCVRLPNIRFPTASSASICFCVIIQKACFWSAGAINPDAADGSILSRDTYTDEIIETYPMGATPKSKAGKQAYQQNWRRKTAAEKAAMPGKGNR